MYCQSKVWEVQHRTTESCGVSGMKVIDTALKRANLPLGQGGEPTPVPGRIHLGTWTFGIIACGYWNENSHHRLICLTIWYPVGRIVWKWLGGVSLLENMCHWGWDLRFQKTSAFHTMHPCLLLVDQAVSSQLFLLLSHWWITIESNHRS